MARTFAELMWFHSSEVRRLNALFASRAGAQAKTEAGSGSNVGSVPVEFYFEIIAAFDHVSRHWHPNPEEREDVPHVCQKAHAHLKRFCLDVHKIQLRDAIDRYGEIWTQPPHGTPTPWSRKRLICDLEVIVDLAAKARLKETGSGPAWSKAWNEVHCRCAYLIADVNRRLTGDDPPTPQRATGFGADEWGRAAREGFPPPSVEALMSFYHGTFRPMHYRHQARHNCLVQDALRFTAESFDCFAAYWLDKRNKGSLQLSLVKLKAACAAMLREEYGLVRLVESARVAKLGLGGRIAEEHDRLLDEIESAHARAKQQKGREDGGFDEWAVVGDLCAEYRNKCYLAVKVWPEALLAGTGSPPS